MTSTACYNKNKGDTMDTTITLPAGGKLHASRSHLCLAFEKTRFSLSTAIYGGGFKEINYAVNQKLETFYPSEDRFPGGSVPEFLRLSILENGYDPAKACALLTAAKMEWRSVKTFSHKELLLDAVTTGGAEKTAARAGSPPLYTEKDGHFFPVGTINIMISLNISLPSAIMTRAIITITEGKTAALLTTALRFGAMSANATEAQLEAVTDFGYNLGLAFQVIDDILDLTASTEKLGKTAGKDVNAQKSTCPALIGMDGARSEAKCRTQAALDALMIFPEERRTRLVELANYLLNREY